MKWIPPGPVLPLPSAATVVDDVVSFQDARRRSEDATKSRFDRMLTLVAAMSNVRRSWLVRLNGGALSEVT